MKHYTKRPLEKSFIFRLYERDRELLRSAAAQKEVSQSDFIRAALREKASRVLAGIEVAESRANASRGVASILADQTGAVLGIAGAPKKSKE